MPEDLSDQVTAHTSALRSLAWAARRTVYDTDLRRGQPHRRRHRPGRADGREGWGLRCPDLPDAEGEALDPGEVSALLLAAADDGESVYARLRGFSHDKPHRQVGAQPSRIPGNFGLVGGLGGGALVRDVIALVRDVITHTEEDTS